MESFEKSPGEFAMWERQGGRKVGKAVKNMETVIEEAGEALLELLAGGSVIFMFVKLLDYAASF